MEVKIKEVVDYEIVHYADKNLEIFSKFSTIMIRSNDGSTIIKMPTKWWQKFFGLSRLTRRLLRLDKMCVIPTATGYVSFWQGKVYHIARDGKMKMTLTMNSCRNPLHNSIACINGVELFFGEYGPQSSFGKSVYRSADGGMNWEEVYRIFGTKIKHIHACKWDPYTNRIWVLTGDFNGQSYLICADKNFSEVEWIGDGSQYYRTLDLVFTENEIHWCMDSPLQDSFHVVFNRGTKSIKTGYLFPGPVWYVKQLSQGGVIVSTAQEIGPAHKDDKVHLLYTKDFVTWFDIAKFRHDGLPKRYFKFGVVAFSDGEQTPDDFFIHAEAIEGLDGKVLRCSLLGKGER